MSLVLRTVAQKHPELVDNLVIMNCPHSKYVPLSPPLPSSHLSSSLLLFPPLPSSPLSSSPLSSSPLLSPFPYLTLIMVVTFFLDLHHLRSFQWEVEKVREILLLLCVVEQNYRDTFVLQ